MKLQSLPTFLVRRKNWLLMAALALSLTAALLLRPSSPQAQRVTLPMTSAESSASPLEAFRISRDSAYQRDMVPRELIDQIVEAGLYAPSGMNRQPVIIIAVSDPKTRDALSRLNASILDTDSKIVMQTIIPCRL